MSDPNPVSPVPPSSSPSPPGAGAAGTRARKIGALDLFLPNRVVSGPVMGITILVQAALVLGLWLAKPVALLPGPQEVLQALARLWSTQGLGPELFTSLRFSLEALAWSTAISLTLSYLTVLPVFRPAVALASKGRFLSLAGFSLVFTLLLSNAHLVKLALLVFAMSVFFVTSMASVVAAIPKEKFDHARTLRMSEWEVAWEVVVLGTLAEAFEILRQNAAIGWMMLTTVEGLARAEGGVGVFLLNQQKHFKLEEVFAIQLLILGVGLFQDYGIGLIRRLCCPHADLTLERRSG